MYDMIMSYSKKVLNNHIRINHYVDYILVSNRKRNMKRVWLMELHIEYHIPLLNVDCLSRINPRRTNCLN